MTTRAHLQFSDRTFNFEAGEFEDGITGDEPVPTISRITASGLDGSRHALEGLEWPLARWTTQVEIANWHDTIVQLQVYRSYIGQVATPVTVLPSGGRIAWKAKRVLNCAAAKPVATLDGWLLVATWEMRYEGGP